METVGTCRKAIEVFQHELEGPEKESAIGNLILARTDGKAREKSTEASFRISNNYRDLSIMTLAVRLRFLEAKHSS